MPTVKSTNGAKTYIRPGSKAHRDYARNLNTQRKYADKMPKNLDADRKVGKSVAARSTVMDAQARAAKKKKK